jgi:glycosyltransferase involved in cell wall biosynthesis
VGIGGEFIWLTAGRIVPAKDLPNLLRAFEIVIAAIPAAQLWIAGEAVDAGMNPVSHFTAAANRETMKQVRWLGLRRDMPALLDAADGFVLASAWEGMPLVVGEAMAMEKPVVATDVGGVRELVGEAGVLVPAGDSLALANGMIALMQSSAEGQQKLGRAGRSRIAAEFSIEARADQWERLYQSLIVSGG